MLPSVATFTAFELSNALGTYPQAVRNALAKVPHQLRLVRGKESASWALDSLPSAMKAKLARSASDMTGYRGIHHFILICQAKEKFAPSIPVANMPAPAIEKAAHLRSCLAPILKRAEEFSIREMARQANLLLANDGLFSLESNRTTRRRIERILARDGGHADFDRLELYAEEFCQHRQERSVPEKSDIHCPAVEITLQTLDPKDPSFKTRVFAAAVEDVKLLAQTHGSRKAKAAVMDALESSGIRLAASRDCLRKKMDGIAARVVAGASGEHLLAHHGQGRSGRKPKFSLSEEERTRLTFHRLQRGGSLARGIEDFARDPICRPETRMLIHAEMDTAARERRIPRWPKNLHHLTRPSNELAAHFFGPKHRAKLEMTSRRGMFHIDDRGQECPTRPNDIWESDDMSLNEPFRYTDPETGEFRPGRQILATLDVASAAWLAAHPIGRDRDAYRAEDIADHIRNTVIQHGLPLCWRIERGRWDNDFISGTKLKDGSRWGGLDEIINILSMSTSNGKATIETRFNPLQREISTMSLSIGRHRGEREAATKLLTSAQNGNSDSQRKFWTIKEAAEGTAKAMERQNQRPAMRRACGRQAQVPAELYRNAGKRECPKDQRWRFLPIKRDATVRGDCVEVSVKNYPRSFRFRVNGVKNSIYLHRGETVLIAFHPARPEEGCWIFDGERTQSPARNFDSKFGQFLLMAEYEPDVPQFSMDRGAARPEGSYGKKKARAAMVSQFRGITPAGTRSVSISESRDGLGSSFRHAENSDPAFEVTGTERHRRERDADRLIQKARREREESAFEGIDEMEREFFRNNPSMAIPR